MLATFILGMQATVPLSSMLQVGFEGFLALCARVLFHSQSVSRSLSKQHSIMCPPRRSEERWMIGLRRNLINCPGPGRVSYRGLLLEARGGLFLYRTIVQYCGP